MTKTNSMVLIKRVIALLLVLSLCPVFVGCSKDEKVDTLEKVDSYYRNGKVVISFINNSGQTITSVNGRVLLWSSDDVQLGANNFYWTGTCEPAGLLTIEVSVSASGSVSRIGYYISSINNGEIDKYTYL